VTTNGTHLGIRPSSSAVVQATTSPGGRANTNILTVSPANGNVLALVGPPNTLAFVEVSNPPPPPPSGIIVEWEWWRLFPTPDPRVRMADMTASIWIAVPDGGSGDWLLTWFKGESCVPLSLPFYLDRGDGLLTAMRTGVCRGYRS